ncbi:uncharacterized protein [Typha angustifolia]|uniref:uncharacterized protein n=1 Tax=Typha angustifolia TaxID=59011 RepID=UPI003C2C889F
MDAKSEKVSLASSFNHHESPRKSSWFRSSISDLEESTKDLLALIRLEDGDSFAKRAEMYYHKKPEIEKRIEDFHRLCQLLVDYCSQIFTRSSLSSRRIDNFPGDQNKFESSNSNPESVVEDPELDSHAKSVADGFDLYSKDRILMSTNLSDRFVLVEDSQTYFRDEREKIDDKFVEDSEIFRPLEQLVEDNFKYMNELSRRLDERRRCNKELKNQIEKVMRENQLLKTEIASLHMMLQNQTSEDNINTLMCSRCLKSKVKNKASKLSRIKSLFLNAICVGENRIRRQVIKHDQCGSEREPEITRAE